MKAWDAGSSTVPPIGNHETRRDAEIQELKDRLAGAICEGNAAQEEVRRLRRNVWGLIISESGSMMCDEANKALFKVVAVNCREYSHE